MVDTDSEAWIEGVKSQLGHPTRLEREKAVAKLEQALQGSGDHKVSPPLTAAVKELVASDHWQQRLGGFLAAKVLVAGTADDDFDQYMLEACRLLLEDEEVRVRLALGEVLQALAAKQGPVVWEQCSARILDSISACMERDGGEDDQGSAGDAVGPSADLITSLLQTTYRRGMPGTGDLRHDTEGWKCLETSFKALHGIMLGCWQSFRPYMTAQLLELIIRALLHQNRFVREMGYNLVETWCNLADPQDLRGIAAELASKLADGLSDNWSQVRYTACVATRAFMVAAEGWREETFPLILPQMCLNRYYVAEGVRTHSQATWRLVMGDSGRTWVARCAPQVVEFYTRQAKSNNHAVREAACACIAELAVKVDPAAVAPHAPRLLRTLLLCFKDRSWPVRDVACLAVGRCVRAYPEQSRPFLDQLYPLWFDHLTENIPTVREDAAIALGHAVRAYGQDALDRILLQLRELLPKAKEQARQSQPFSRLENSMQFGRVIPIADAPRDSGEQMFGSSPPRLRDTPAPAPAKATGFSTSRLTREPNDCCMDEAYVREREPWEASDGAVCLVRELSEVATSCAAEFLPGLVELAKLDNFAQAHLLQERIWRQLPKIARNMGKRPFKAHLEPFLDPLFRCLSSDNQLSEAAAGDAIAFFRDWLGPRIFGGRLTEQQLTLMETNKNVPPVAEGRFGGVAPLKPTAFNAMSWLRNDESESRD